MALYAGQEATVRTGHGTTDSLLLETENSQWSDGESGPLNDVYTAISIAGSCQIIFSLAQQNGIGAPGDTKVTGARGEAV